MQTDSNPWSGKGIWLKGNIHTHTVNSDGLYTPDEIASEYGRHGYDFVFLTDHNKVTTPAEKIRKPLIISAEEIACSFNGDGYHFVCLGLKKAWKSESFNSPMQVLERAEREGVFVVQAHPYWCGTPSHKCVFQGGVTCPGVEIYNTICDRMVAKGYSSVHWDDLLDAGHRILGFAVDDAHIDTHVAGGWIMVKARNRSAAAILSAIRNGTFYSSQGPEIKSITTSSREIKIACSPVMRINFITNRSGGCSIFAATPKLCEALWTVPQDSTYVRIELVSVFGKIAWSNPIYFRTSRREAQALTVVKRLACFMARSKKQEDGQMNYGLTERQEMIRDLCRQVANEKIKPVRAHYDETGEFPHEIVKIFAQADLCGLYIEEKYGGLGGGVMDLVIAVEELSKVCSGIALSMAATALATFPIIIFGTEEQKLKYLPRVSSGQSLAAFGLTEADAGSDAGAIATTARRDGDDYIINGTKQWITNGGEADIYTVIAKTDKSKGARGASAFILEKGMKGFGFGKKENKMGIRASTTRELVFQDCRVPKANLLGREGLGFIITMKTLDMSRPGVAAQALGIAEGALDEAVKYSRERRQFGSPISSFQGIQFMLADMATQVEASRALIYQAARYIDSGAKDISKISAMCKLFASDAAMRVTTDAVQVFGGYGYMKEYPVEKMMRDAKITQIYEGTNQIQREVIALNLIKEAAGKKE